MIEINHIALFTIGFLFYWILPVAVGSMGFLKSVFGTSLWYEIYDSISNQKIILYLIICCVSYLMYISGSSIAGRMFKNPLKQRRLFGFGIKLADIYLVPAVMLASIFAFLVRGELFKGYRGSIYEGMGWRGTFTATSLLLLILAFIYVVKLEQRGEILPKFRYMISNRFFIAYFIIAILVLSMGGRLYFFSGLLMVLVYWTVFIRRISIPAIFVFFVIAVFGAGIVGLFRSGAAISLVQIIINLFIESAFVSFSLIHFLSENTLELLNFPIFLASDFINIIPTFIFPGKAEVLLSPDAYGYIIFAPGGALNSFFSFMINFGVFGTWIVLFILGFFLNFLRNNGHLLLFKIWYVMLSGCLAFTFFRDPFSISIVKMMFEFSILIPTFFIMSMHLLTFTFGTKKNKHDVLAIRSF